jgi:hypothetical protein
MASSIVVRTAIACSLVVALLVPAHTLFGQRYSPAEGPWSGQAQCVVVAKWADYLDEQTHTWRLTGTAPTAAPRGSAQVYYTWPATWSVQGSGRKTFPSRTAGAFGSGEQAERWTIASEMNATLRMTEIAGRPERLRIGADGQRGAPLGSIRVTEVSGRTRDASVQPWSFPAIEDDATSTTISGTSTRTYPEGFGVGWGQPPKAITTATCAWSFTRAGVDQSSANTPPGGRGVRPRTPIADTVSATTSPQATTSGSRPIETTPGAGAGATSSAVAADSGFAGTAGVNGATVKIYPTPTTVRGLCAFVNTYPYSYSCGIQWVPAPGATGYVVTDERLRCDEIRHGPMGYVDCGTWTIASRTDYTVGMTNSATITIPGNAFFNHNPDEPHVYTTQFYVTATYPNGGQSVAVKWCDPNWEAC